MQDYLRAQSLLKTIFGRSAKLESGDWLYYVRTDEFGPYTFATTNQEFQQAKLICIERDLVVADSLSLLKVKRLQQ